MEIYIDDIIFGATNKSLYNEFFDMMHNEFEMFMIRELWCFLGRRFINQIIYYKKLLKRFNMDKGKSISTLMSMSCILDKDGDGKAVDERKHQVIIGSLLYLTTSYLDIMFVICLYVRFQANLK